MFDKRQPTEYNLHLNSGNFLFPQSQRKFLKKRHEKKNMGSNAFVLFLPRISSKGASIYCPSRDLAQKAKSQGSTLVNTYSWNNYTVNIPEKSWFAWTGTAWNCWVMMMFLLFVPTSKRWLGWHKIENPEGITYVDFVTFIVQSYFDTLLHYILSVTFRRAAVLKVTDQKTLVKSRWSYKVHIPV